MMKHRPLTVNTDNWCDVSTEPGQVLVKGGFNRKGASADAIQYLCEDNVTHTFVALHKDAAWFVKGVGGSEKGSLKAVQVLAMLRQKANEHCPAVAGSDSQNTTSSAADEADPMESMISTDCVAASLTEFVKKNTKKRKVEKVVRSCVQELTVPLRPACVGTASLEEVTIFVYTPPTKKKTQSSTYVWIVSAGCCRTQPTNWPVKAFLARAHARARAHSSQIVQVSTAYAWNGTSTLKGGTPPFSQDTRKGMCYTLGRVKSHPRCSNNYEQWTV